MNRLTGSLLEVVQQNKRKNDDESFQILRTGLPGRNPPHPPAHFPADAPYLVAHRLDPGEDLPRAQPYAT